MMDIGDTIAPKSDQLDAVDLIGGPATVTITGVSRGEPDQPVNLTLAEFERPWRPGKSMRRVLVAAWGRDASVYVGRSLTIYCDPDVKFGGERVGGIRVSHMSDIDKLVAVPLLVSRGKSAIWTVAPLATPAGKPDALADAKRLVMRHAEAGGHDLAWVRDDYLTWSSGGDLADADTAALLAYARTIEPTVTVKRGTS